MTVAEHFRHVLTHETSLDRATVETALFDDLARLMHSELGEVRCRELGLWHVVSAFVLVPA